MTGRSILFISTVAGRGEDKSCGGGEHFAVELLQDLSLRGWAITLVCPATSPLLASKALRNSLDGIVLLDLAARIRQPVYFFWILINWVWYIRKSKPLLIYGNGYETLKWLALAKRISRAPAICHLHESYYEPYYAPRSRRLSQSIDRFFAISKAVRNEFHRGAGVPLDRIALVPNGVPVSPEAKKVGDEVRAELGLPAAAPLIVMAARTDPLKGHEVLLKAVPTVLRRHPESFFLFIGVQQGSSLERDLYQKWKELIHLHDIASSVRLEPYRTDVRWLMNGADMVVVPSLSEGFGRTAIEAMAEETAVIASNVGGLAEIVVSGVNGLLFPPGDPDALAAAINRLLDHPDERAALAAAGRAEALKHYSTAVMVDRIESELLRITGVA